MGRTDTRVLQDDTLGSSLSTPINNHRTKNVFLLSTLHYILNVQVRFINLGLRIVKRVLGIVQQFTRNITNGSYDPFKTC